MSRLSERYVGASSSVGTTARAGLPAASAVRHGLEQPQLQLGLGSPDLAVRAVLSSRFSTVARSASPSSMLITSRSRTGSTAPITCWMSGSSKQRTTCRIGVDLADVGQELVAQPLALAGALDEAGDVDELDRGGHHALGVHDRRERVEPRIGDLHDPGVRLDGREGIVRDQGLGAGEGVEEGGLADVGQADDSQAKHGDL